MKKVKLFLATLLTVVLALFCLAGCSVEGTYKLSKIVVENGDQKTVYRLGDEYQGETLTKDFVVWELKENGKFTLTMGKGEGQIVRNGTWKEKDDDIFLTVDGVTIEVDEDDGYYEFEPTEGVEIYLKKQ